MRNSRGIQIRLDRKDHVLLPSDVALGVANLLVPNQAVPVAVPCGDDVAQPVAVDVVDEHLGGLVGEVEGMPAPRLARLGMGRLLPPAAALDDVDSAVAVDVAAAQSVRETLIIISMGRDGMKGPGPIGLGGVVSGVAQAARFVVDQLGPAVAVDVGQHRRLVAHVFQGQVFLPRHSFLPAGFSNQAASPPGNGK